LVLFRTTKIHPRDKGVMEQRNFGEKPKKINLPPVVGQGNFGAKPKECNKPLIWVVGDNKLTTSCQNRSQIRVIRQQ